MQNSLEYPFFFRVTGPETDDGWPCNLLTTEASRAVVGRAFLGKWNIPYEPPQRTIPSGSTVYISVVGKGNVVFVKDMSEEAEQMQEELARAIEVQRRGNILLCFPFE